jgi:hypothetical protein
MARPFPALILELDYYEFYILNQVLSLIHSSIWDLRMCLNRGTGLSKRPVVLVSTS